MEDTWIEAVEVVEVVEEDEVELHNPQFPSMDCVEEGALVLTPALKLMILSLIQ